MRSFIKKVLPDFILRYYRSRHLLKEFKYDYRNYRKSTLRLNSFTKENLIGDIIRTYHVIEKGLTMPNMKIGFGQQKIIELLSFINNYVARYGVEEYQLKCAVAVMNEYVQKHKSIGFVLPEQILDQIKLVSKEVNSKVSLQPVFTKEEFFENVECDFMKFSNSRHSVREYSDVPVSLTLLKEALSLAQNTPSACNRQCWRVYVFSDRRLIREILNLQGGSRGFNHLTDKLIVVAAEQGVFVSSSERNQSYIDGGLYTMNLLYSLHYKKIACCVLNCCHTADKDGNLRKLCGIKGSEVFISMISCGNPPKEFSVASSPRYSYDVVTTFID